LEAILKETAPENTDADFLKEAVTSIGGLQTIAQLRTFQSAMGRGPTSKWEWHDMVTETYRKSLPKKEAKRQK
jgi:RHO1 GDP-GTP exchange protein 1/2